MLEAGGQSGALTATRDDRPILRLGEDIIGQIAAGEVVESPASAVKELVENSLDAGATCITVEIRDGGISYLRVTDNGRGIPSRDVRMAFERHATSKIRSSADLFNLQTLGFRGEALASIAAVSKLTLTTRHAGEAAGTRVVNEGGEIKNIAQASSPQGTTIVVRELFYNTPVRLKFLKKPVTEASKVADVIARLILARPDISLRLIHNEKQIYQSSGNGELRSAVFCLYGRETASAMIPVRSQGGIGVNGLVGVGAQARSNRSRQTFIVNGRTIRSALLTQALEDACQERFTVGHFPICVLNIDMPANLVDVNVHPNKLEVRFSDENLVYQHVRGAVKDSFGDSPLAMAPHMTLVHEEAPVIAGTVRVISTGTPEGISQARQAVWEPVTAKVQRTDSASVIRSEAKESAASAEPAAQQRMSFSPCHGARQFRAADVQEIMGDQSAAIKQPAQIRECAQPGQQRRDDLNGYSVIGVAFDTYILLQNEEQLVFVDQHAAHERILYEKLMREIDSGSVSQELLIPQTAHVTPQDRVKIETYREDIHAAGYDIVPLGDDAYSIRAVPNVLGIPESLNAFLDMVDHLGELRTLDTRQKRRDAILQMACKRAVKGGDRLTAEEILPLLDEMMAVDAPATCPHGRPLIVVLTRSELEKRFKRINN